MEKFPMRHRKKLIAAALLLLAGGYASLCFWPHSNPAAVRALAALREMVETDVVSEAPGVFEGNAPDDMRIDCEVVFATINMTDATTGLFAEPRRVNDTVTVGRIKKGNEFPEMLRSTGVARIGSEPHLITVPGGRAEATWGGVVHIVAMTSAGTAPVEIHRNVGTKMSVSPNVTAAGSFVLDIECELTQVGRQTIATPIPDIHVISAKARAELKPDETLVLGGLSQKRPNREMFKLPVLGELPGIGSWFRFIREREIDEELVVLVSPRIVYVTPQIVPRAAPPAPKQMVRPAPK
jgi:Flp pilus assembly secretin CpaC